MKYSLISFCLFLLCSCKKTEIQTPLLFSEASYTMTVKMNWTSPQFAIPSGAHVTTIIGMVHSKDTSLWKENALATPGLEDVAEVGYTVNMNKEIDAIIANYKAVFKFQIPAPSITGTAVTTLNFNTVFSVISFASMIAPSPDWFMGISNVNLIANNKWVDSLTLNIRIYDAGTEEGNVFDYNNPSTFPQQKIMTLTATNVLANGNSAIGPIATVYFQKN